MSESIRIETTDISRCVFVSPHDGDVWINIVSNDGTKNCTMSKEQAQSLIEALQIAIQGETEE